jgi:hypothetical protein
MASGALIILLGEKWSQELKQGSSFSSQLYLGQQHDVQPYMWDLLRFVKLDKGRHKTWVHSFARAIPRAPFCHRQKPYCFDEAALLS